MSTINWENALGGDWSVGTNWELGLVPAGDTEITLPGVYTVSISGNVAAANLAINASAATLAESAAGSLTCLAVCPSIMAWFFSTARTPSRAPSSL